MTSSSAHAGKRLAIAVTGATGPDDVLNQALEPRGFASVVFVPTITDLIVQMRSHHPSLVILPIPQGGVGGELSLFEAELRRRPETGAIGTAPTKDADSVLFAMRAGITEFVTNPIDQSEFAAAVSRVLSSIAGPQQAGRVFTVYAAKGGVGTSTIAASLAWALAQLHGKDDTALVDFNTAGAGLRVMLNLSPTYDLGSVAARTDRLDRDFLRSVMTAQSEHVSVLAAAEELDAVESLDAKVAGTLVELLRHDFVHTVIDTDHHFNDQTLAALDAADRILLVTQFDVSALRSTQRSLGVFARLGYAAEKTVIVANRRTERDRISGAGAERVLGRPILFTLPNDYAACSGAITQGQYVERFAPASPLVASFKSMASALTGHIPGSNGKSPAPERSRLSRMFSRKGL
jgi:pilus assembly protein CpaE